MADIEKAVAQEARGQGWEVRSIQNDSEGELIGAIHKHRLSTVGGIVNPGALMIAGWSLRDALASYPQPWIEVHLSNVWAREQFRHESVIAPLASGVVVGLGAFGYRLDAQALPPKEFFGLKYLRYVGNVSRSGSPNLSYTFRLQMNGSLKCDNVDSG